MADKVKPISLAKIIDILIFFPVAVNYQTDGRMMQLYRGKFKSNGNCGYVLKPYVMCGGIMDVAQFFRTTELLHEHGF